MLKRLAGYGPGRRVSTRAPASSRVPSGDRMPDDGAGQRIGPNRQVELAVGDRQAERHAAIEPGGQRGDEAAIDGPELHRVGAMNAGTGEPADQLRRVFVRVD